ncbi:Fic family protein [uncultured Kordia sp.]|uniref:Fic family protein n=1 Tax=uncultured Kordia sp. TaxID=507699 RepID=UPI002612340B|nr:Fic family protein [uncultured Kordia sp.]
MEELKKAVALKNELDSLRPIDAEREAIIMQKFRLDWNYHSNHLEGNTLTYGETKALLLFNITAQGKPLKDHIEVTGHNEAINWVLDMVKGDRPLTENFIRQIHTLLLKEPYEVDAKTSEGKPTKKKVHVGEYKKTPNHVETVTGEIFRFATPEETPAKMTDLLNWYRDKIAEETVNPILLAAEFHYKFIRIHPFDDGNGRTARIIMNFVLMKYGFPPTIIKTQDKENYFAALRLADSGNIEAFIQYIAQNLVHSLELMIAGAKGENIEEADDIVKEVALLKSKFEIINERKYIIKTDEEIRKIISNSFLPFYENLKQYQEKLFKSFYEDTAEYYNKDGTSISEGSDFLNPLGKHKYKINLDFRYLKIIGYEVNFNIHVIIEFKRSEYELTIETSQNRFKEEMTYPYGMLLSDKKAKSINQDLANHHKNFIENFIEKKENSKK